LGVFDLGGNGLVESHDVTLFKINSGAGAANANVSAITGGSVNIASGTGASLESSFRFKALTNPDQTTILRLFRFLTLLVVVEVRSANLLELLPKPYLN
jgi:hypothetical protein